MIGTQVTVIQLRIPHLGLKTIHSYLLQETTTMLELYRLRGCPYCAKVEKKLNELDLRYETHDVNPIRRLRSEVKEVSGQTGVPVLVDPEHGVDGMAESTDIVNYLEETYT